MHSFRELSEENSILYAMQDEQEFSFYNVRPNTAATYHQQKQITMESSVDENGGLDNRQCEAKQTGESTEAA